MFRILPSIYFEIVKSQWEEKQKIMILWQFFSSSIFWNYWKFKNRFSYQLKQMFLNMAVVSGLHYFFVKILTRYKTDPKLVVTIPSLNDIVWHVSIAAWSSIIQHWGDSDLHGPNKVLFHVTRTWYYLQHAFNS